MSLPVCTMPIYLHHVASVGRKEVVSRASVCKRMELGEAEGSQT